MDRAPVVEKSTAPFRTWPGNKKTGRQQESGATPQRSHCACVCTNREMEGHWLYACQLSWQQQGLSPGARPLSSQVLKHFGNICSSKEHLHGPRCMGLGAATAAAHQALSGSHRIGTFLQMEKPSLLMGLGHSEDISHRSLKEILENWRESEVKRLSCPRGTATWLSNISSPFVSISCWHHSFLFVHGIDLDTISKVEQNHYGKKNLPLGRGRIITRTLVDAQIIVPRSFISQLPPRVLKMSPSENDEMKCKHQLRLTKCPSAQGFEHKYALFSLITLLSRR